MAVCVAVCVALCVAVCVAVYVAACVAVYLDMKDERVMSHMYMWVQGGEDS